jgi:NAD(P)-dependent dehydrogenase (short-subunit alcohol dehydrogenase family)
VPRIFITGSTDGLGRAAARVLMGEGHVVISVNECDSLRDEGVNFYRLLLQGLAQEFTPLVSLA